MSPFAKGMKYILSKVVSEKSYLERNPKSLSYLMSYYDKLHYGSRYHPNENFQDWQNPKDEILDLKTEDSYKDFVYDAWASVVDDNTNYHPLSLEMKVNKTLDDWVELALNPNYRYRSLYADKESVVDFLFLTIGNGLGWNAVGCICQMGPCGTDCDIFIGYNTLDIGSEPLWFSRFITESNSNQDISLGFRLHDEAIKKREEEMLTLRSFVNDCKTFVNDCKTMMGHPIKTIESAPTRPRPEPHIEYSLLGSIPQNAHPSYLGAARKLYTSILDHNPSQPNIKSLKSIAWLVR